MFMSCPLYFLEGTGDSYQDSEHKIVHQDAPLV